MGEIFSHNVNEAIEKKEKRSLGCKKTFEKGILRFVHILIGIFVTSEKRQKKIVLFVDDLDRCSEEKLIEIIDSLRIMLDEEDLKEKLTVVTAVDERMLRMAVEKKFDYDTEKTKEHPDLTREYIDKLFIFSIKLGPLDGTESGEFFDKLVKNEFIPEVVPNGSNGTESQEQGNTIRPNMNTPPISETPPREDMASEPIPEAVKITIERLEKPTQEHINVFKSKLGSIRNSTPRKIRILFYRYLFARNLLIQQQGDDGTNYWFSSEAHGVFIELLIQFSQEDIKLIHEEKNRIARPDQPTNLSDEKGLPIGRDECKTLLSIFETTIAY